MRSREQETSASNTCMAGGALPWLEQVKGPTGGSEQDKTQRREKQLDPATGGHLDPGTQNKTLIHTEKTVRGPVTDTRCPARGRNQINQIIAQLDSHCYCSAIFRRSRAPPGSRPFAHLPTQLTAPNTVVSLSLQSIGCLQANLKFRQAYRLRL